MGNVTVNNLNHEVGLAVLASPVGIDLNIVSYGIDTPIVSIHLTTSDLIALLSRIEQQVESQARHFKDMLDRHAGMIKGIESVLDL